jgi:hypothetical protein
MNLRKTHFDRVFIKRRRRIAQNAETKAFSSLFALSVLCGEKSGLWSGNARGSVHSVFLK